MSTTRQRDLGEQTCKYHPWSRRGWGQVPGSQRWGSNVGTPAFLVPQSVVTEGDPRVNCRGVDAGGPISELAKPNLNLTRTVSIVERGGETIQPFSRCQCLPGRFRPLRRLPRHLWPVPPPPQLGESFGRPAAPTGSPPSGTLGPALQGTTYNQRKRGGAGEAVRLSAPSGPEERKVDRGEGDWMSEICRQRTPSVNSYPREPLESDESGISRHNLSTGWTGV